MRNCENTITHVHIFQLLTHGLRLQLKAIILLIPKPAKVSKILLLYQIGEVIFKAISTVFMRTHFIGSKDAILHITQSQYRALSISSDRFQISIKLLSPRWFSLILKCSQSKELSTFTATVLCLGNGNITQYHFLQFITHHILMTCNSRVCMFWGSFSSPSSSQQKYQQFLGLKASLTLPCGGIAIWKVETSWLLVSSKILKVASNLSSPDLMTEGKESQNRSAMKVLVMWHNSTTEPKKYCWYFLILYGW